ncbi:hypothetical protein I858_008620 [Planococcus versutus]|uniref:HTH gntR-type domain-containing protein n=2 Tax=Planococcus versutus TaxID=1302659 RepID=A0A1B1S1I8_9BACL|nr:hypothetical protein I858_008620 [Planococcus versutus]
MRQEFKEGEHLKEHLLSQKLNVSRGPIREAISKLEGEGLVFRNSNGRAIVQKFGESDIHHLYESRILLENYSLASIQPELLEQNGHLLYEYLNQMEMFNGTGMNVEADIQFHYCLVKMTGNKTLIRLWWSLNEIIKTLIEVTSEFASKRQKEIILEHKVIVDAIFDKDIEKAQQLLRVHLEGASDYYSKAVFKFQEGK